jgi:hypothetical protein
LKLRVGYELQYEFPQPTPLIAMLNVRFSRVAADDLVRLLDAEEINRTIPLNALQRSDQRRFRAALRERK